MYLIAFNERLTQMHCTLFLFSLLLSAAVNPTTCNISIQQQTIISTTAVSEAIEDDELIIIKKHKGPPFIGVRVQEDWTHTFTGLKPAVLYRIRLEFASLVKVGAYELSFSLFFNVNDTYCTQEDIPIFVTINQEDVSFIMVSHLGFILIVIYFFVYCTPYQIKNGEGNSQTIEMWTRPHPNSVLFLGVDIVSRDSKYLLCVCSVSIAPPLCTQSIVLFMHHNCH